ncbi:WD40 repeat domain-containing protein [Calothrix sp. PCC 7507]|uniref:WD40 repeat domain-containing protein n=1 Tax=Calothrix sp. PCC 7507 TaxID=99598 RepID=UPI00029F3D49|nr:WD40 repeat domain-containing protein [Calothrix sp. PCC 7507]AFY32743.1 WD-40 repeat-containing protein [Calothrix sp. PCC 7507]
MANSISTTISEQVIKFKPGGTPASFNISVTNDSDRFAAFQLEMIAAGADVIPGLRWYNFSPEVSAKKPPGDRTRFTATITDSPVPGFAGIMNLTVRIFSLELGEETREVIRLVVEKSKGLTPVKLTLPVAEFPAYPSDLLEIPVSLYNPSQLTANVVLNFLGVDITWLVEGNERRLQIPPGGKTETTFLCQLPIPSLVPSQPYPFTIEADLIDGPLSSATGTIIVLPKGFVDFNCIPKELQMPPSASAWWIPKWKCHSATYILKFDNASNLRPDVTVLVQPEAGQRQSTWELIPEKAKISPGEITELQLTINKRRHWWGGSKKLRFEVKAIESETDIDIRNDTQFLKLNVLPVLPIWMQLLIGAGLLTLAWACSWLNPNNPLFGHTAPVTSVQFNGMGDNAVSGGNDQKIIKWDSAGFLNPLINQFQGDLGNLGKAVRVVRYRPVDNNLLAAGLENGESWLFNLAGDGNKPIDSFLFRKDDRVLALEFTKDSRYLFSGHGSGYVLQWDVQSDLEKNVSVNNSPFKQKKFDFAVSALALAGKANKNLMVGGRFNQLWMWNFEPDKVRSLPYQEGSKDDYIQSLTVAAYKPNLMATADNQGYITLWNLDKCLSKDVKCTIVDRWGNGHGSKPVRSVVLNRNGCYLASGGDDGRVMLWPLNIDGKRHPQFANGQEVGRSEQRINSVDLKRQGKNIFVLSGSDDTQVRIDVTPQSDTGCK